MEQLINPLFFPKIVKKKGEITLTLRSTVSQKVTTVSAEDLTPDSKLYYKVNIPPLDPGEYEYEAVIGNVTVYKGLAYVKGASDNKKMYNNNKPIVVYGE